MRRTEKLLLEVPCDWLHAIELQLSSFDRRAYRWTRPARQAAGDLEGAVDAMSETVRRADNYRPARLRLGDWSIEAGDLASAEDAYAAVLDADSENVAALLGLARVALERRDPRATAGLAERALAVSPDHALAHHLRLQAEAMGLTPAPGFKYDGSREDWKPIENPGEDPYHRTLQLIVGSLAASKEDARR